jgi:hypothetical protein
VPPELAAAAAKACVSELDRAWSTCPRTLRRARLLELTGWAFYVTGRGGVLGDGARSDTVAAALGLVSPDAVRAGWDAVGAVRPAEVAAARLAECARWGDENLGGAPEIDTLVALAERVVIAADAVGMPLFAASRSMPVPAGGTGARAAVLVHLMWEHRTGAQLLAVRACDLTPVEVLVAGPEGESEALMFGWHPPFPARGPLMRRYLHAEAVTDRIAGQAFAALTVDERRELSGLLARAARAHRSAGPTGTDPTGSDPTGWAVG